VTGWIFRAPPRYPAPVLARSAMVAPAASAAVKTCIDSSNEKTPQARAWGVW
jgi:hypothetical protein